MHVFIKLNRYLKILPKMNTKRGYIYVRSNKIHDIYNAYKVGSTQNIPERETTYITNEITRGIFVEVYEVPFGQMNIIERLIQYEFSSLNIRYDAGTEFFDKSIVSLIEPFFDNIGVKYKRLSKQEIFGLMRCNRVREKIKKINHQSLIDALQSYKYENEYTPRADQTQIINKAFEHYQNNDKGLLVLTCGVGKTLISLWISQKLTSNTIIIGVSNTVLLSQWKDKIKVFYKNFPSLIVSGNICVGIIQKFLKDFHNRCVLITTYSSSHKVFLATKNETFKFDMKILDEAHHLTSINMKEEQTTKKYIEMLKIPSDKQLSLTATLKQIEPRNVHDDVISNDNVEHFGAIIDKKCLLWAINENIICDYVIQTIVANEEQLDTQLRRLNITEDNDKRLFLSAYASLKSIYERHSHHLLIYSNNKYNSLKLIQYIKMLLDDEYFDVPELYHSNYHSEMKSNEQKKIINSFEKAKFGIISCVYCLGEGWDFPLLDGVVFAENMTSNIRIVQSALRSSRKDKTNTNKISKIILPILNKDDWLSNNANPDLKKVREVIYHMGMEDETIVQKIKVFRVCIEKHERANKKEIVNVDKLGEYDEELTQKLKLKTIKRSALATTYEKARKIIAENNVKSKDDYYELCERDNRLSLEPEIDFKGKFTNWIDYLSIQRVYYDLETCKNKVGEYLSNETDIDFEFTNITKALKILDDMFPPYDLWCEYYDINDLTEIIKHTKNEELVEF